MCLCLSQYLRCLATLSNVQAQATVKTSPNLSHCPGAAGHVCSFRPDVRILLDRVDLEWHVRMSNNGRTIQVTLDHSHIPSESDVVDIITEIQDGEGSLCHTQDAQHSNLLDGAVDALNSHIASSTMTILKEGIDALANAFTLTYTLPVPLMMAPIGSGRELDLSLFVTRLSGGADFLQAMFVTSLSAHLSAPAWRAGASYLPKIEDSLALPEVGSSSQVNVNIGSSGLNAAIQALWYIGWSIIPMEKPSESSATLCEVGPNDPCLFPPITTTFDSTSNPEIYDIFARLFNVENTFGAFEVSVVIPPPAVGFSFLDGKFCAMEHPEHFIFSTFVEPLMVYRLSYGCRH